MVITVENKYTVTLRIKFLNVTACGNFSYHGVLNRLVSYNGEYKYCILLECDVVYCSKLDTSSSEKCSYKIKQNYISENEEFEGWNYEYCGVHEGKINI